jgi:hypothetical protein
MGTTKCRGDKCVPVSGRASVSDLSGIQDESQRGSLESGGSARAWLSSLSNREAFSNLTTREIRNGARNVRSYLERVAGRPHLTQQQRNWRSMRRDVRQIICARSASKRWPLCRGCSGRFLRELEGGLQPREALDLTPRHQGGLELWGLAEEVQGGEAVWWWETHGP